MRVLAIQLKRIGDLILTLPALSALRRSGAHVTLALTKGPAGLLPAMTHAVDEAAIYGPGAWKHVLRGGFDACIDFTGRDRSALLTLASRARRRIVSQDALRGKGIWRKACYNALARTSVRSRHTVDYYLDHLAPLDVSVTASGEPTLQLPAGTASGAHGLAAGSFIVIHPGTARPEKYWRPERWAAVIDHCEGELGIPCVLTGGRGDAEEDRHLDAIRARLKRPCVDLAGRLSLLSLAAVLGDARLAVGVDSGPMHLAAAVGTPVAVLFGPTNPFHWRPRGTHALVLRAGRDEPLAASDFQDCSPGLPMERISTTAVICCIRQLVRPATDPQTAG